MAGKSQRYVASVRIPAFFTHNLVKPYYSASNIILSVGWQCASATSRALARRRGAVVAQTNIALGGVYN